MTPELADHLLLELGIIDGLQGQLLVSRGHQEDSGCETHPEHFQRSKLANTIWASIKDRRNRYLINKESFEIRQPFNQFKLPSKNGAFVVEAHDGDKFAINDYTNSKFAPRIKHAGKIVV